MCKVRILAASLLLAFTQPAWAYDLFTGKVTVMHFNADVYSRGVCVKLLTTAGESPWACLYKFGELHTEMNALLKTAYTEGRTCTMWVAMGARGYNEIRALECS